MLCRSCCYLWTIGVDFFEVVGFVPEVSFGDRFLPFCAV